MNVSRGYYGGRPPRSPRKRRRLEQEQQQQQQQQLQAQQQQRLGQQQSGPARRNPTSTSASAAAEMDEREPVSKKFGEIVSAPTKGENYIMVTKDGVAPLGIQYLGHVRNRWQNHDEVKYIGKENNGRIYKVAYDEHATFYPYNQALL